MSLSPSLPPPLSLALSNTLLFSFSFFLALAFTYINHHHGERCRLVPALYRHIFLQYRQVFDVQPHIWPRSPAFLPYSHSFWTRSHKFLPNNHMMMPQASTRANRLQIVCVCEYAWLIFKAHNSVVKNIWLRYSQKTFWFISIVYFIPLYWVFDRLQSELTGGPEGGNHAECRVRGSEPIQSGKDRNCTLVC